MVCVCRLVLGSESIDRDLGDFGRGLSDGVDDVLAYVACRGLLTSERIHIADGQTGPFYVSLLNRLALLFSRSASCQGTSRAGQKVQCVGNAADGCGKTSRTCRL